MDNRTQGALELIIRDRDAAQLRADRPDSMEFTREAARSEVRAYNMALATFAGAFGYTERRRLELALAAGAVHPLDDITRPGPDDPTDEDEPQVNPADLELAVYDERTGEAVNVYPTASAVLMPPMGGWEPRS